MMFLLKQFLKPLILPPVPWFVLFFLCGIFWRRRWARGLFWIAFALLFLFHSPELGEVLRHPLESRYTALIDPAAAEPYDAIVVLMAGVIDRKSTRLNSSHEWISRMASSAC